MKKQVTKQTKQQKSFSPHHNEAVSFLEGAFNGSMFQSATDKGVPTVFLDDLSDKSGYCMDALEGFTFKQLEQIMWFIVGLEQIRRNNNRKA